LTHALFFSRESFDSSSQRSGKNIRWDDLQLRSERVVLRWAIIEDKV
jgi:hypothetical protein